MNEFKLDTINTDVGLELYRATRKFDAFHSAHEGFAVIKEELDELWDLVKSNADRNQMREEAIQVAAMAIRFIYDLCEQ